MKSSMESQLLLAKASLTFFGVLPSFALALCIILWNDTFWLKWMLVSILILTSGYLMMSRILRRIKDEIVYDNVPRPSTIDILRLTLWSLLIVLLLYISTSGFMFVFWRWGYSSPIEWFLGILGFGVYFFSYQVFCALTTKYSLSQKGLWIIYGPDIIFIPYARITSVSTSETVRTPVHKIIRAGYLYTPGVRNRDFLVITINVQNPLVEIWFPEIYITPNNSKQMESLMRTLASAKM